MMTGRRIAAAQRALGMVQASRAALDARSDKTSDSFKARRDAAEGTAAKLAQHLERLALQDAQERAAHADELRAQERAQAQERAARADELRAQERAQAQERAARAAARLEPRAPREKPSPRVMPAWLRELVDAVAAASTEAHEREQAERAAQRAKWAAAAEAAAAADEAKRRAAKRGE